MNLLDTSPDRVRAAHIRRVQMAVQQLAMKSGELIFWTLSKVPVDLVELRISFAKLFELFFKLAHRLLCILQGGRGSGLTLRTCSVELFLTLVFQLRGGLEFGFLILDVLLQLVPACVKKILKGIYASTRLFKACVRNLFIVERRDSILFAKFGDHLRTSLWLHRFALPVGSGTQYRRDNFLNARPIYIREARNGAA